MNRDALQLTIIYTSISYFKTLKVSGVRICMKTIDWEDINQSQLYFKVLWIDTTYIYPAVNFYYVGYIVWPSIQYDIDVMHSVWIQPVFDVGAK